jgi:hypothetical protein
VALASKHLLRIIRFIAACAVIGLVPCGAQTGEQPRIRAIPPKAPRDGLVQSRLPAGKTMATATDAELLEAVCKAVRQSPAEVALVVKTAGRARKSLRADILCRSVRCAQKRSIDCTWVIEILRQWMSEDPENASRLSQTALECAPDCIDLSGGASTGMSGGSSNRHAHAREFRADTTGEPIGGGSAPPPHGTPEPGHSHAFVAEPSASPTPGKRSGKPRDSASIPEFKIPPPLASALQEVPRELLTGGEAAPRLGNAEAALNGAFTKRHYSEKKYYALRDDSGSRNGFALASSIERINPDGSTNEEDRWVQDLPPIKKFSIADYVAALFRARPGRFRVIVFVLTDKPLTQNTDARVSSDEAKLWTKKGAESLPKEIAEMGYTSDYKCTALIYEFKTFAGSKPEFVEPSEITGEMHLEKSGILAALQQPELP